MFDSLNANTIQQILIWVLLVVGIIAVCFLISLIRKLSNTVTELNFSLAKINELLDDSKKLLDEAAKILAATKHTAAVAQKSVYKAAQTIDHATNLLRLGKSKFAALTGLLGATTSLLSLDNSKKRKTKK